MPRTTARFVELSASKHWSWPMPWCWSAVPIAPSPMRTRDFRASRNCSLRPMASESLVPQARIQGVAQGVAEDLQGEHYAEEGDARERDLPPVPLHEAVLRV